MYNLRATCPWKSRVTNKTLQIFAKVLSRLRVCYFSRWTRGKNIFQSFSFTTNRITKYSLDCFLSSRGQKMSKDFLSCVLCEIVSNLKNACAQSDGINNARRLERSWNQKNTNKQTSDLLKLTSRDAAPESPASTKARIALKDFWTSSRIQQSEVRREAYFWKRWFPITFFASEAFLNQKHNKHASQE